MIFLGDRAGKYENHLLPRPEVRHDQLGFWVHHPTNESNQKVKRWNDVPVQPMAMCPILSPINDSVTVAYQDLKQQILGEQNEHHFIAFIANLQKLKTGKTPISRFPLIFVALTQALLKVEACRTPTILASSASPESPAHSTRPPEWWGSNGSVQKWRKKTTNLHFIHQNPSNSLIYHDLSKFLSLLTPWFIWIKSILQRNFSRTSGSFILDQNKTALSMQLKQRNKSCVVEFQQDQKNKRFTISYVYHIVHRHMCMCVCIIICMHNLYNLVCIYIFYNLNI